MREGEYICRGRKEGAGELWRIKFAAPHIGGKGKVTTKATTLSSPRREDKENCHEKRASGGIFARRK